MFWPILECSIITAGLWIARHFVPHPLVSYADVIGLILIVVMFVWLVRRAGQRGEQRGVTDYRRLRQAAAHRILANDRTAPGERETER